MGCGGGDTTQAEEPIVSAGTSGSSGQSGSGASGQAGSGPKAGSSGQGGAAGSTAGTSSAGGSGGAQAGAGGTSTAGSAGNSTGGVGGTTVTGGSAGVGGSVSLGGSAGVSGSSGQGGSAGSGEETLCPAPPTCDLAPPNPGPKRAWNHSIVSAATAALGSPNHRGRDLFLTPGDEQWIIGKFAYGLNDKDIKEEEVDLYLLRDCTTWEKLGTSITTADTKHPTQEGVEDSGGRVYFRIPNAKKLGPGLHRVHMVVAGDLTTADLYLEVVDKNQPIFVSDVDGTLTTSENVEFTALLQGELPDTHIDAPQALGRLAEKGYHPMYLTARPEWLTQRTRDFMKARGFPPGIIHTTTTLTGNIGGGAATFKSNELAMLAQKGLVPSWVFGNTETDAQAYDNAKINPIDHRVFYQYTDTVYGGRRIEEYTELLGDFGLLPKVCK